MLAFIQVEVHEDAEAWAVSVENLFVLELN